MIFNNKYISYLIINFFIFDNGKKLFEENCSICHINGENIIIPEKNLKFVNLKANGMDNINSIMYQITNGKNGMPAFGSRLEEKEIEEIANYILKNSINNF